MTILFLIFFTVLTVSTLASTSSIDIVQTFEDLTVRRFNHLTIDKTTGNVYIGGVNKLYQLTSDLNLVIKEKTGPEMVADECLSLNCQSSEKILTDNVNKVLLLDYSSNSIIACGTLFRECWFRNSSNISTNPLRVREAVVSSTDNSSTVAFIAPGPPHPSKTRVMYVGVTYTSNDLSHDYISAISSRSLDRTAHFEMAFRSMSSGSFMYLNSLSRDRYPINYVYGFASGGFSYFLTTQKREMTLNQFISKIVRICHDDKDYYSYTEIPIQCIGEGKNYNLVQSAYVGKPGHGLASNLGITTHDDVLYATFTTSKTEFSSKPAYSSGVCIFSLSDIQRKFTENIRYCFAGNGTRGLDYISPSYSCIKTNYQIIEEDFCGLDVNTPLGGEHPISATPIFTSEVRLTAIAATPMSDMTAVFLGTITGYLKKIALDTSNTALEYENVKVQSQSEVNSDLFFDTQLKHLYVMTERKVSKLKLEQCALRTNCSECLGFNNQFCGWCASENKCSLKSDCQKADNGYFYWTNQKDAQCVSIRSVTPNQIERTTTTTLNLLTDGLLDISEPLQCVFSILDRILLTNATKEGEIVKCPTPTSNSIPLLPSNKTHIVAKLFLKTLLKSEFVSTNFKIYDCARYNSCTECVSSEFLCDWCVNNNRCNRNPSENCRNDILITGGSKLWPGYKSGRGFCPAIKARIGSSTEMLVPSGTKIGITVNIQDMPQFLIQSRFVCRFNIDDRIIAVNALLLGDSIYCAQTQLKYKSQAPKQTAEFSVYWDGDKTLDNPEQVYVVVYKCRHMASDCKSCLEVLEKYQCGWCQRSNSCEVRNSCNSGSSEWIKLEQQCHKNTILPDDYRNISVVPNQMQKSTSRTLEITSDLSKFGNEIQCVFRVMNKLLITDATRIDGGVKCQTPGSNLLPIILPDQGFATAQLSLNSSSGLHSSYIDFTIYDCASYISCTQCVSSQFPCDWCIENQRCTHDTSENCRSDILITGVNRPGSSFRSGSSFCPAIKLGSASEILVPFGVKKGVKLNIHIIGHFMVRSKFTCQFNVEGKIYSVDAHLLGDDIYCNKMEFSYSSSVQNLTVPMAVVLNGLNALDNPDNIHVVVYKCEEMANSCLDCAKIRDKYECDWCESSKKCLAKDKCDFVEVGRG